MIPSDAARPWSTSSVTIIVASHAESASPNTSGTIKDAIDAVTLRFGSDGTVYKVPCAASTCMSPGAPVRATTGASSEPIGSMMSPRNDFAPSVATASEDIDCRATVATTFPAAPRLEESASILKCRYTTAPSSQDPPHPPPRTA